jgi:hypothetical protein
MVIFAYAFTGRKTPLKNRTAIIFSYLIILLFLVVPIAGPVALLQYFPDAVANMIGAPAGLVKTHTPTLAEKETQWAVNIGGDSFVSDNIAANSGTGTNTNTNKEQGTNQASAAAQPQASSGPNSPATTGGPNLSGSNVSMTGNAVITSLQKRAIAPWSKAELLIQRASDIPPVEVHGGIVIPLYVIVLSAIGGAINMTRKVPVYQREGEEAEVSLGHPISNLGTRVMRWMGLAPAEGAPGQEPPRIIPEQQATEEPATEQPPLEQQAATIEAKLTDLITEQIQRNCATDLALKDIRELVGKMQQLYKNKPDDVPLLKFNSFEDWMASHARVAALLRGSWRVELLNQYMYLISAPFLAIVTYYILDILSLTKQGVVVVLSFSVGLISEKIVTWILGIATGYLTEPKKT